jgi:hypothetical protein
MDAPTNSDGWDATAQAFVSALDGQRAGYWAAADVVKSVLDGADVDQRLSRIRELAKVAHSSASYIARLAELADAFPQPYRYPDVAQAFYVAVLNASKRTKERAIHLLDKALRYNWHIQKLNNLGTHYSRRRVHMTGQCLACGGWLSFSRRGDKGGLAIPCPGCLADARVDRRSLLDAFVIVGQLT